MPMVRTETRHDGGHVRLIIDQPTVNILSIVVMRELRDALGDVQRAPRVRLVTIEGAGDHFSYGASVEEHRSGAIATALGELHGLVRALLACPAPTAAIVRGRCLGGGFEVALACDLIFASTTAVLGVPEITLGVFPPAASALLPPRIGASRAAGALLTGRAAPVEEWMNAGLIELVAPADELQMVVDRWFDANFAVRSAAALRCAAQASRLALAHHVEAALPRLEQLYLETLMRTHDAGEGIEAFLEKRQPQWVHA
jgi:cyclohexa-1,5-dienecarbonyl-CoA hydratase